MKNKIIELLGGVKNIYVVHKKNQGTKDIINGILETHNKYKKDYDKIYKFFYTGSLETTCKKLFDFLKENVKYKIESETLQTLRSPAAILSYPADCKSYALFINGILDACNRKENKNWNIIYRFAGYDPFNNYIEHVFSVAENNKNEFWIDPVLQNFDERKKPYYIKDKKINNMALVGIAGIDKKISGANDKGEMVGAFTLPPPKMLTSIQQGIQQAQDKGSGLQKTLGTVSSLANLIPGWGTAISSVLKMFNFGSVPDPNAWQGWGNLDRKGGFMLGTNAATWVLQDGDSVQNEAWNILKWIENYGIESIVNENSHIKERFGKFITLNDLINKMRRGGYNNEASQLEEAIKEQEKKSTPLTAGSNIMVTLALVGAGAFLISKMRK